MDSPGGIDDDLGDEHLFDGVRFVLVGFDQLAESQYRLEIVRHGGIDAGGSDNGCTHVIVWNRIYDDPDCVAARAEGKKVVTDQWVEDSLDRGVLADADRAIYWPPRDLKGIPGAESLFICLTGYKRNHREDIMKMVNLMGAQFSKDLKANLVTHLICYKFEGDKYDVCKMVHFDIKFVNHRWLEDCLKAWEILPVDDYRKSSWELELMEAEAKDSEDEAEGAGQKSFSSRSSVRRTPSSSNRAETSVNPDVNVPMQSPIVPFGNRELVVKMHLDTPGSKETEDTGSRRHDIAAQCSPKSSPLAVPAQPDVFAPTSSGTPFVVSDNRKNVAVSNITSPLPIQEAEEKYVGARTLDSTDNVSGKYSASFDQIDVNKAQLDSPSKGHFSMNGLDTSKVDGGQHEEKDGLSRNLIAAPGRSSNIDYKATTSGANPNLVGDSLSNNISNPSNSKKASQKPLSPEGHFRLMASHQRPEESTLKVDFDNSSLGMGQQRLVEHGNTPSIKCIQITENVELGDTYPQKRKSLISPGSLNFQNEDLVSENRSLDCPVESRLSDAFEPANVSSVGTCPAEANAVGVGKKQSRLSTSRQSSSRRNSLNHGGPVNGVKLHKHSSSKNVKSLQKERTPNKAMAGIKCTTSPSATAQDGNTSSGFSFQSKNGKDAQTSGNAGNHSLHLMHETGTALTKVQAPDISVHSNSQGVSYSGNADTSVTDLPNVKDNKVAVASNSEVEKVLSDANVKEGTQLFRDTSSNFEGGTSYSKQVAGPVEKNAGAKRPRSASMDADGSLVDHGKKGVPESRPAEVIPCGHPDSASKNACSTARAVELKTISPKKVPISRVRKTISKKALNAHTKMDDGRVASSLQFSNGISPEKTEINIQKVFDTANADEHQRTSPKKLPHTRVRNTAAKKSRKSDTDMSNEALRDKTETVAAGSLFDDLFPSDNVEDCPKRLPNSASASDSGTLTPKNVSNPRVPNAAAKRKIKGVEDKLGSKCSKIGSAITSVAKAISLKRNNEASCNNNEVTADEGPEEENKDGTKDTSGLFCQDSTTVDKPGGPQSSRLRSSLRNRALTSDHEKENKQDHSNLNSNATSRTGSLCSKFDAKSMQKGTSVLCDRQLIKGNESETLITSPALFILSGDRQQRKEYRSILRRLKGRFCRDSHHWSYQATHFIAPDPLKRTEKFFAAAAAGRWILKRDYLTSCDKAGKFLDEEPFEWFGTGLSDGEKISLEAPRKWRVLRQQMHHGAFYGMQIIVYGELVLPTLDTLKRAVRAGDGTILATSPPYTRFLNSGVDFAVVANMPSADAWVQEFIRHGIPCVSADYLVDYVCKPGHPLNRHVLFKTNDQADKSHKKLMKNQHEVATDELEPSSEEDEDHDDDLPCSVCGSKDRGEVMLICGDEGGTVGCGIGMHIDCCDPPLDAVPDGDWLCPQCSVPKAKAKPARGNASRSRGSKRR